MELPFNMQRQLILYETIRHAEELQLATQFASLSAVSDVRKLLGN